MIYSFLNKRLKSQNSWDPIIAPRGVFCLIIQIQLFKIKYNMFNLHNIKSRILKHETRECVHCRRLEWGPCGPYSRLEQPGRHKVDN